MNIIKKYLQNHWAVKKKKITMPDGKIIETLSIDYDEVKYAVWKKYSNIEYAIKKIFNPWNVLKLTALDNEYSDRDWIMMHAIFQCLVDFVELEQPYIPNDLRWKVKGRFTDINLMREQILGNCSPAGLESYFSEWDTDEDKARTTEHVLERARIDLEILYLYEWYKLKKYEFNDELIMHIDLGPIRTMFGERDDQDKSQIYLTSQEHTELEEEHNQKCDHILRRVLAVRRHLWT